MTKGVSRREWNTSGGVQSSTTYELFVSTCYTNTFDDKQLTSTLPTSIAAMENAEREKW